MAENETLALARRCVVLLERLDDQAIVDDSQPSNQEVSRFKVKHRT